MQANQTQQLTYIMTLASPFTVQSAGLSITRPDGVSVAEIAATVSPNTSNVKQTVTVTYTPPMGGEYQFLWRVTLAGTGMVYTFSLDQWVMWTDIYTGVRNLLGASVANISDAILDAGYRDILVELTQYAPSLPEYSSFNTRYYRHYDQGVTKLLASRVRPFVGGKRPTGEISLFKKGTTTVQYSVGSARNPVSLEQQWWEQGMLILEALIPEIANAAQEDRAGDETMTRGDVAIGNTHARAGQRVYSDGSSLGVYDIE